MKYPHIKNVKFYPYGCEAPEDFYEGVVPEINPVQCLNGLKADKRAGVKFEYIPTLKDLMEHINNCPADKSPCVRVTDSDLIDHATVEMWYE